MISQVERRSLLWINATIDKYSKEHTPKWNKVQICLVFVFVAEKLVLNLLLFLDRVT